MSDVDRDPPDPSIETHLIHSCTVQRSTSAPDAYRNARRIWSNHLTGVRCRLISKAQRVINRDQQAQLAVVTTYTLLLPRGTDIIPDDRVTMTATADDFADVGPFRVAAVLPRRSTALHHVSVALERVN